MKNLRLTGLERLALAGALLLGFLAACGGPPARTALAMRPIDEGRAAKIIAESLRKEGLEAGPAKEITLNGKKLVIDVTIQGKKYAIVYMSANDVLELGSAPIAKKKELPGDPLRIEAGSSDEGKFNFVVLYATDYQYDDNEGIEHESTTITAENKLDRDVRDFLMIAKREHFE